MRKITLLKLKEFLKKVPDSTTLIVDVRPMAEFDAMHIDNTMNIPIEDLNNQKKELWTFKTIIVISTNGTQALKGCRILQSVHPRNLYYTYGNIRELSHAGIRLIQEP